jgi:dTDP-4-amino-4,6-dideoxygalactose transaminase
MLLRPEFEILKADGIEFENPNGYVELFESRMANYAGAKYGVAVDCVTHAIELCLRYVGPQSQPLQVPSNTYPSVPMTW